MMVAFSLLSHRIPFVVVLPEFVAAEIHFAQFICDSEVFVLLAGTFSANFSR